MLPPFYQIENAVRNLDEIIKDCESPENEQVIYPQFSTANLDEYQVIEYSEPQCWRLSMVNDVTGEYAPVRMRIQGIVSDLELPPVRKPGSLNAMERMRAHIRQGIMLTGCQSELFHRNMEQIELLQVKFSGALPANSMKDWQPTYEGANLVIDMHNRYFTKRSLAPNRQRVYLDRTIDPHSVLDEMQRDSKFIHLEDNHVDYYQAGCMDRSDTLVNANPSSFRAGDLVETTVEFAAFPAGANQNVTVIVLKSVKMITAEYRNAAAVLAMRSRYKPMFWHTSAPSYISQAKRKSLDGVDQQEKQEARDRATRHRKLREGEQHRKEIGDLDEQYVKGKDTRGMGFLGQPNFEACGNIWESEDRSNNQLDINLAEERMRGMQVSDPHVDP